MLTIIGAITSQLAVITALLYYFGWVRTYYFLIYFGVDPSLAGYGTVDYVLRSIAVAFPPFIRVAFTALVLLGFHRLVVAPTLEDAESGFSTALAPTSHPITGPDTARSAVVRVVLWAQALARRRPGIRGMRWFVGAVHVAGVALAGVLLSDQIGVPARDSAAAAAGGRCHPAGLRRARAVQDTRPRSPRLARGKPPQHRRPTL